MEKKQEHENKKPNEPHKSIPGVCYWSWLLNVCCFIDVYHFVPSCCNLA
ncbi:hypothetical protein CCACVL1_01458, partial [Corchorus capsularis]